MFWSIRKQNIIITHPYLEACDLVTFEFSIFKISYHFFLNGVDPNQLASDELISSHSIFYPHYESMLIKNCTIGLAKNQNTM